MRLPADNVFRTLHFQMSSLFLWSDRIVSYQWQCFGQEFCSLVRLLFLPVLCLLCEEWCSLSLGLLHLLWLFFRTWIMNDKLYYVQAGNLSSLCLLTVLPRQDSKVMFFRHCENYRSVYYNAYNALNIQHMITIRSQTSLRGRDVHADSP